MTMYPHSEAQVLGQQLGTELLHTTFVSERQYQDVFRSLCKSNIDAGVSRWLLVDAIATIEEDLLFFGIMFPQGIKSFVEGL